MKKNIKKVDENIWLRPEPDNDKMTKLIKRFTDREKLRNYISIPDVNEFDIPSRRLPVNEADYNTLLERFDVDAHHTKIPLINTINHLIDRALRSAVTGDTAQIDDIVNAAKKFIEWLNKTKVKEPKPSAPAIAAFIKILVDAQIEEQGKINKVFCKDVCKKYDLRYSDKVRQAYSRPISTKHKQDVMNLILPKLNETLREKIKDHLKLTK